VAVYATVVAGGAREVTNSRSFVLTVEPTHNLTLVRVLPVAVGVPLVTLAAVGAVLDYRRSKSGSSNDRGGSARASGIRGGGTVGTILGILSAVALWAGPSTVAAASPAEAPPLVGREGLRPGLTIAEGVATAKTGDRLTVTASVANTTGQPVRGATLFLGLANMTPGQPMPLGLETWTTDPESVALPPLAPGASAFATWHLVMIQPGPLGLYASVMAGPDGPIESSPVTILPIRDNRVLNPASVLPVALGEPLALIGLIAAARSRARRATADHAHRDFGAKDREPGWPDAGR